MACNGVHELINSGDWEGVLWTCFVKVYVVDADSSFPIRFFDHDHICKPLRIVNFPDEPSCEQLSYFFVYGPVALKVELSTLLNNGLMRRINIEPVGYDRMINFRHVLMRPSVDVLVFFEETNELVPKASRQLQSDLDRML